MKKRTLALIIIIPLIIVAIAIAKIIKTKNASTIRQISTPVVKVELPQRTTITQSLQMTGDIVAVQQAKVFAKVYGNIEAVYVNMGDYVRKDQLLAQIDTTELAQQYRQESATYQNARINNDRAKAMKEKNLISQQDLENAETALKIAEANYEAARTHLDYARVKAPFSGFITLRYLDRGALVSASNATLFDLADLEVVKVIVNVLEKDIPLVKNGTQAVITVDAYPDKQFEASIARISQAVDLGTRTMPVEVDISNHDYILKPGMFASVNLIINSRNNILTIPTQAIVRDTSGSIVYIAKSDSAFRKTVTVGLEQNSRMEILSGITDSNRVIVIGQQYVRDKSPVKIQP